MHLLDYLRLGWANIVAHKKRAAIVVVIVGVLFGVLTAGCLLIQGLEDATLDVMLEPTSEKVLVRTVAQQSFCEDICDIATDREEIREVIAKWNGEEVAVMAAGLTGSVYAVAPELVQNAVEADFTSIPDDAIPVLASTSTLAGWLQISTADTHAEPEVKLRVVQSVREQSLGKIIEFAGQKYFVAGILPGGFGVHNLSLTAIKDRKNPLNILLDGISTGSSQTLVLDNGEAELSPTEEIWATFASVAEAQGYINDIATHNCNSLEVEVGICSRMKQLVAATVVGDPVRIYENFVGIWTVLKILIVVLAVIACIVTMSTYVRLVGRDTKVIALYHAMGSTKKQIVGVYCVYLLGLSLLASAFSLVLGAGLVLIVNLINMTKLTQIFTIGFGVEEAPVWLFGWNNWIALFVGLLLVMAPLCTILSWRQFASKKLAQKMK